MFLSGVFGVRVLVYVEKLKKNPYIIGTFAAVLCYAFQAAININLPIVAPMMWLLLSIGIGACRRENGSSSGCVAR